MKYRFIVSTIRTGSHLLVKSIISNLKKNMFTLSRVHPESHDMEYETYINNEYYFNRVHIPTFIYKDMKNYKDLKFIFLDRKDKISQAISFYIADYLSTNKIFTKFNITKEEAKYYNDIINTTKIPFDIHQIRQIIAEWKEYRKIFKNYIEKNSLNYKIIYYEDLISNYENYLKFIISYLFNFTFSQYDSTFMLEKTSTNLNSNFRKLYEISPKKEMKLNIKITKGW